jgi:ATP/maltotriose-dependent transcriptional regulator MalT
LGASAITTRAPAAAVPYLEQSLANWKQFQYGPLVLLFTSWLADGVRRLGDLDRGAQLAQSALDLNRQLEFWWAAGWAERVLGHIARERGDRRAARDRVGGALETYRSIHARFEMARTLLALSELADDHGDEAPVERQLREARELLVAVGAHQYLAQVLPGTPPRC